MHVLILVAHPRPQSLTHALAGRFAEGLAAAGHTHTLADLYAEGFNPLVTAGEVPGGREVRVPPEVEREQARVQAATGLALVYPVWWGTPPAILQGWLQRVLTQGFAFALGAGPPLGLLHHRTQLILNIGSRDQAQQSRYLDPITGALWYCGIRDVRTQINWGMYPGAGRDLIAGRLDAAFEAGRAF